MVTRARNLNDYGVTLIELMVVLAIIAILMVVGAFQYQGWVGRYRVEGEVKQMYTDLMNARSLAISKGRMYFINVPASDDKRYRVYEDSAGGLDGDGKLTGADEEITNVETFYALSPSKRHLGINTKGMITDGTSILLGPEYIRFITDGSFEPDYDCIAMTATRVNMGFFNGSNCAEK